MQLLLAFLSIGFLLSGCEPVITTKSYSDVPPVVSVYSYSTDDPGLSKTERRILKREIRDAERSALENRLYLERIARENAERLAREQRESEKWRLRSQEQENLRHLRQKTEDQGRALREQQQRIEMQNENARIQQRDDALRAEKQRLKQAQERQDHVYAKQEARAVLERDRANTHHRENLNVNDFKKGQLQAQEENDLQQAIKNSLKTFRKEEAKR